MKVNILLLLVVILSAFSSVVMAVPTTRVIAQPSAIFINATNNENRGYNCSIEFTYSHQNWEYRETENVNQTAFVPPNVKDREIFRLTGALRDIRIESQPNIQCIGV